MVSRCTICVGNSDSIWLISVSENAGFLGVRVPFTRVFAFESLDLNFLELVWTESEFLECEFFEVNLTEGVLPEKNIEKEVDGDIWNIINVISLIICDQLCHYDNTLCVSVVSYDD